MPSTTTNYRLKMLERLRHLAEPGIAPEQDTVLITGGCGGLGRELVKRFGNANYKVVAVDICSKTLFEQIFDCKIQKPTNMYYFSCDITCATSLQQLKIDIENLKIGPVTVLINNAGITSNTPIKDFSSANPMSIEKIMNVNFQSCFGLIQLFLPGMIAANRGYIVNVASVLGILSPAKLAPYGASKGALINMHELLNAELSRSNHINNNINTLLVLPGQIKTNMFANINTPSKLFAPVLKTEELADNIYKAMMNKHKTLCTPYYVHYIPLIKNFDWPLTFMARFFSKMDQVL
ncbi:hypothetical protein ACO0RG_001258 [Hanseniaspora osmophila]|uniref:Putative oxidoreductase n=1 Tax=Hanseniaspora osmophila TaxID=56408 RepID=A0A1E5RNR1_9ASCO|nr:putative oxidoreductase [Hanseniaspora osmophila]